LLLRSCTCGHKRSLETLTLLPVAVAGYLIGSVPMGVILSRVFGWDDPRTYGSGHTGAMNVSRRAGRAGLIMVLIADLLKGATATLIAPLISNSEWAITVAGIMGVVGHCYPVWVRFNGGMGLATGEGAMLTQSWPLGLVAAALLGIIRFAIIKHTPRATVAAALLAIVAAALLNLPPPVFVMALGVCGFITVRHLMDWNRKYE